MTTFIHTADWQLGKPFSRVADEGSRVRLRQERIAAVRRIGDLARERQAAFVVVAGDVFDSNHATNRTISDACDAIASIGVPVHVIPGNHDHAGPGSVWEQDFFVAESRERAPNLRVHLAARPVAESGCILLPCPLHRRQAASDPCGWLRDLDWTAFGAAPRILVAHGSTRDFSGERDEEDLPGQPNFIHLEHLPLADLDYVALGDWHGFLQAGPKAWYAGAHETDRFPKAGQRPGHVACVTATRAGPPAVDPLPTGRLAWLGTALDLGEDGPDRLEETLATVTRGAGFDRALVDLGLTGCVSLAARRELERILESWSHRLLRLDVRDETTLAPAPEEIRDLADRADDPIIARVAGELLRRIAAGGPDADDAREAVNLLHGLCAGPGEAAR